MLQRGTSMRYEARESGVRAPCLADAGTVVRLYFQVRPVTPLLW